MAPQQLSEESVSFLPGGHSARQMPSRTASLMSIFSRKRKWLVAFGISIFLFSQLYLLGPRIIGHERIQDLQTAVEHWRPPWTSPSSPHKIPSQKPPFEPLPRPKPVATSLAGNPVYRPTIDLPQGYDDPITKDEDHLVVLENAFPAESVKTIDFHQMYEDGDPHQGVIPSRLLNILDRDIPRSRPPKPQRVPPFPPERWVPHSGWSSARNGSKTTYHDALHPNILVSEPDWRPSPFSSWSPPSIPPAQSTLPRVQFPFTDARKHSGMLDSADRDSVVAKRQKLVKNAFLHAWEAYKSHAWGHDEIKPVTGEPSDHFNGWGASIVDALDTLLVMGMPEEYDLARQHVRDIDFHHLGGARSAYGNSDGRVPVFETAIRYLGGFLSAYDLSGDAMMRDRAEELAQLIMPAFDTKTGVPIGRIRFDDANKHQSSGSVILAEAGSMLLEMTRLWQVTGNRTYFDRVQRVTDWLDRNMTGTPDRLGTLLPTVIFPERGTMYGTYSWGGMADSTYEYLIKEHQLLGGRLEQYGRMFGDAVDGARQWLIRAVHSVPNAPLLVFGHSNGKTFQPKLEHLSCFAGGSIGLGAKLLADRNRDLLHAQRLTETCWWAYNATATGIGPEDIVFYRDKDTDRFDTIQQSGTSRRGKARGQPLVGVRGLMADYRNRPETIESVFYMWRITGDRRWQERGWQMFCSWVTHGLSYYGFSSISSVLQVPAIQTDSMESFVFAETFKYYYLLFSPPSLVSLDDYIFTTEAHPILAPQNGEWARPASGPTSFWDISKPHVPQTSDIYSGGEQGPVGGLTNVQKQFIHDKWKAELDAEAKKVSNAKAEQKAKDKSMQNIEKLHEAIDNPSRGQRLTGDDLQKAMRDVLEAFDQES